MLALVLLLSGVLVMLMMPQDTAPVADAEVEAESPRSAIDVQPISPPTRSDTSGTSAKELFSGDRSFDDAKQLAAEQNKPMLVYATADWCGPCKVMQKTTFAQPAVQEAIRERTVPMYLDLTVRSARTPEAAISRQLGVRGIPVLIMLRGEEEISRVTGITGAEDLIEWIDANATL